MKKAFKIILFLVVLFAIVLGAAFYYADSIILSAVNKYAPRITQTNVHLGKVSTSLLNTNATLEDLVVGNPEGFNSSTILKLGKVHVDAKRDTLTSETVVINEIDISDVLVTYEFIGTRTNLGTLSDNIASYTAPKTTAGAVPAQANKNAEAAPKKEKRVVIKNLAIRNAKVQIATSVAGLHKSASVTLDLPDIVLHDIGGDGKPMTVSQTIMYVLQIFSLNTIEAISKSAYKGLINVSQAALDISKGAIHLTGKAATTVINTVGTVGEGAVHLTGEAVGTVLDTVGAVGEMGKGIGKSIGNELFGK